MENNSKLMPVKQNVKTVLTFFINGQRIIDQFTLFALKEYVVLDQDGAEVAGIPDKIAKSARCVGPGLVIFIV